MLTWWKEAGWWKWIVVVVVGAMIYSAATSKEHGASSESGVPAADSGAALKQTMDNWGLYTKAQQLIIAKDCRDAASGSGGIASVSAAEVRAEMESLDLQVSQSIQKVCDEALKAGLNRQQREVKEAQEKRKFNREWRRMKKREVVASSPEHHGFHATDAFVRTYMHDAEIGMSVREVLCEAEESCTIAYNEPGLAGPSVVAKLLGIEQSAEEELDDSVTKLFAALYSVPTMQDATIIEWVEAQTVGGKEREWPALRVTCTKEAADKINWLYVEPEGLRDLCSYDLLPDGRPPA